MWEYKVVSVKHSFNDLNESMNEFGMENWEIFKIDELLRTNEVNENGDFLFQFRLYMKRQTIK